MNAKKVSDQSKTPLRAGSELMEIATSPMP
jgi:hypothetical protein